MDDTVLISNLTPFALWYHLLFICAVCHWFYFVFLTGVGSHLYRDVSGVVLGLTLVHLPQFSAARSPESLSKPCFKFTNVSANWPVPVSVTDVWGTLEPGLALHDKIPLFWDSMIQCLKKCLIIKVDVCFHVELTLYSLKLFPIISQNSLCPGWNRLQRGSCRHFLQKALFLRKWYFFSLISSSKILRTFESQ